MRVIVAGDHGNVVADYSTVAGHRCVGPALASANAIAIAALAETIGYLSPDLETQTVALAVDIAPAVDSAPRH